MTSTFVAAFGPWWHGPEPGWDGWASGWPWPCWVALCHAGLTRIYHPALATGFARGFLAAAAVMLLALIITAAAIRNLKADLAGVNPMYR